jgi:hypothetical protein
MCWVDVLHFIFMWHPALISWRLRLTGCIMWKFRCRFVFVCCCKHWQDVCNVFLPCSSLSLILVSRVWTLNLLFCGSYVVVQSSKHMYGPLKLRSFLNFSSDCLNSLKISYKSCIQHCTQYIILIFHTKISSLL